jgi:hypothetical protein
MRRPALACLSPGGGSSARRVALARLQPRSRLLLGAIALTIACIGTSLMYVWMDPSICIYLPLRMLYTNIVSSLKSLKFWQRQARCGRPLVPGSHVLLSHCIFILLV